MGVAFEQIRTNPNAAIESIEVITGPVTNQHLDHPREQNSSSLCGSCHTSQLFWWTPRLSAHVWCSPLYYFTGVSLVGWLMSSTPNNSVPWQKKK